MGVSSQYYVFLGAMLLPVTPEKIEISMGNMNKTITLVDQGEVNILRSAPLKEIKFDMLIPSFEYPFVNYSFGTLSTSTILANIERMKKEGKPVSFIITRCRKNKPAWWTAFKVSLEDFNIVEDANNGTDVIVSITLKQFKNYATKRGTVSKDDKGNLIVKFKDTRLVYAQDVVSTALDQGKKAVVKKLLVDGGTTLYNVMKTKLGSTSFDSWEKFKSLNSGVKNVIDVAKEIKLRG